MASLDMGGPYPFTAEEIERVCRFVGPGTFALGESTDVTWLPRYIGRSDADLKADLLARLDAKYPEFKWSRAFNIEDAFAKQCRAYHEFGGPEGRLDNPGHPAAPPWWTKGCPVAGCAAALVVAADTPRPEPLAVPYIKIPGEPVGKGRTSKRTSRAARSSVRASLAAPEDDLAFLNLDLLPGEEPVPYLAYDKGRPVRYAGRVWRVQGIRLVTPPARYNIQLLEAVPGPDEDVMEWNGPPPESRPPGKRIWRPSQR